MERRLKTGVRRGQEVPRPCLCGCTSSSVEAKTDLGNCLRRRYCLCKIKAKLMLTWPSLLCLAGPDTTDQPRGRHAACCCDRHHVRPAGHPLHHHQPQGEHNFLSHRPTRTTDNLNGIPKIHALDTPNCWALSLPIADFALQRAAGRVRSPLPAVPVRPLTTASCK